ncbi:hypothetical protein LguiA_026157 [Lonicera macranthoides]
MSYNNLSGSVPKGKQFDTFQNDSYIWNLALCGDPLSRRCGDRGRTSPLTIEQDSTLDLKSTYYLIDHLHLGIINSHYFCTMSTTFLFKERGIQVIPPRETNRVLGSSEVINTDAHQPEECTCKTVLKNGSDLNTGSRDIIEDIILIGSGWTKYELEPSTVKTIEEIMLESNGRAQYLNQIVDRTVPINGSTSAQHLNQTVDRTIPTDGSTSSQHLIRMVDGTVPTDGSTSAQHPNQIVDRTVPIDGSTSAQHLNQIIDKMIPTDGSISSQHLIRIVDGTVPTDGSTSAQHQVQKSPIHLEKEISNGSSFRSLGKIPHCCLA